MHSKYRGLNENQWRRIHIRSVNEQRAKWEREQRNAAEMSQSGQQQWDDGNVSDIQGHQLRVYERIGEGAMRRLSGLTTHYMHGIYIVDDETMAKLGIPMDGMESVWNDRAAARQKLEDDGRIERSVTDGGTTDAG